MSFNTYLLKLSIEIHIALHIAIICYLVFPHYHRCRHYDLFLLLYHLHYGNLTRFAFRNRTPVCQLPTKKGKKSIYNFPLKVKDGVLEQYRFCSIIQRGESVNSERVRYIYEECLVANCQLRVFFSVLVIVL